MKLRRFAACLGFVLALSVATAQDTYRELSALPWNGDWLTENLDQMVHGEDYFGYPGPMPKMLFALGMDVNHPAKDYELLTKVKREAPHWHGTCNGWAAAAITHAEPGPLVINGVKLFGAEAKAILSNVWKDNVEVKIGFYDFQGMTAESFERILNDFIAKDIPIIFDVTLGEESWNYPVSAFRRTESRNGNVVDVETTVFYTDTLELLDVEVWLGETLYRPITYTYRITEMEGAQDVYEWTGEALTVRPHRAWYPTVPYLPGDWHMQANRFFNMALYERMLELNESPDALRDHFEPNDSAAAAAAFPENLALACIAPEDVDWLSVDVRPNEPLDMTFEVYDGPRANVALYDLDGKVVASWENVREATLTAPPSFAGKALIKVEAFGETASPVFYKLQASLERSWLRAPIGLDNRELRVAAVNTGENAIAFSGPSAIDTPHRGAAELGAAVDGATYRADGPAMWAVEEALADKTWKAYYRNHPLRMTCIAPHLTFRNGWTTKLMVDAASDDPIWVEVYGQDGALLEKALLPNGSTGRVFSLDTALSETARQEGAWFKLATHPLNAMTGYVRFEHSSGLFADRDLAAAPRSGEQFLWGFDGINLDWVGISLVNTSGVDNEILYRLYDERQEVVENGKLELAPGGKWLGVPGMLFSEPIGANYHIRFFSQFEMESLVLRRDFRKNSMYAHSLMNPILDQINKGQETFVSVSNVDPALQQFGVSNMNLSSSWVTMEAFSAAGDSLGKYRVTNKAIRGLNSACVSMADILAEDSFADLPAPIAYFRVTSEKPVYFYELVGAPDNLNQTFVRAIPVFEKP